jgi:hypothetical protein
MTGVEAGEQARGRKDEEDEEAHRQLACSTNWLKS